MSSNRGSVGRTSMIIAVTLLWLGSAALGLVAVYYLLAMAVLLYDLFIGHSYFTGVFIGQATAVVAGLIWLGSVIATGEYHLKHYGQRKSWQIIAWMLGIEVLIIVVGMLTTGAL